MKILRFGADWCSQCVMIEKMKILDGIKEKYPSIEIEYIDIEDTSKASMVDLYKVKTLPTLIFINNDVEIKRLDNGVNRKSITEAIEEILNGK